MTGQPQEQYFALGVWGPWASALVDGYKDVENRMWWNAPAFQATAKRLRGQRLVVHESKKWDVRAVPIIRQISGHQYSRAEAHPGHLIGVVTLVDFVDEHPSRYYARGQQALVVKDGVRFAEPIQHTGRQGFMLLKDPDKVAAIREQLHAQGVTA